jgi:hypothetical protein
VRRLRSLSEAECYARCYGGGDAAVRLVRLERPLRAVRLSGERVRRLFEDRLDARAAEAA